MREAPAGKKLHARALHHENTQKLVHEVFVHHFRLLRRGEEMMHISNFAMLLHSKI